MSEAITTTRTQVVEGQFRDINTVTAEIKFLHAEGTRVEVSYAVQIGRRLKEAKELLGHGQWGQWVKENLPFSQNKAIMFMKIYEEYGSKQESLFGELNSQTFVNLGVSRAFVLLDVPENEREEFVKENHVDEMSVQELKKAIAERDAAKAEQKAAESERDTAKTERDAAIAHSEELRMKNEDLTRKAQEAKNSKDALKAAQMEREKAEKACKEAQNNLSAVLEKEHSLLRLNEELTKQNESLNKKLTESKEPDEEFLQNLRNQLTNELSETAKAEGRAEAKAEIEELQKQLKASSRAALYFEGAMNALIAQQEVTLSAMKEVKKESPEIFGYIQKSFKEICEGFFKRAEQI